MDESAPERMPAAERTRSVALRGSAASNPRWRYALGALLDPLGLRLAEDDTPAAVGLSYHDPHAADAIPLERIHPRLLDDAFAALTLAGEASAALDAHGRPAAPASPPPPVLQTLTRLLAEALGSAGLSTQMRYAGGERFAIALTHDVDSLGRGRFAALRNGALGIAARPGSPKARLRRTEARAYFADRRAGRDASFPLAAMLDAERAFGWSSTCYFLVGRSHRLDGVGRRYLSRLAPAVEACREHGLEVGLHASYRSREREDAIADEAALFERRTGHRPTGMRHHFLRSRPERLASQLRRAGLDYDTSIGWAEVPGPRAGTPFPYRLWDPASEEAGAWELPLFVMDTTFETYVGLDAERACEAAIAALEPVAAAGGACAVLWHPPSHHPVLASGYDVTYRKLLAWIRERGGVGDTARGTLERWQTRVPSDEPARDVGPGRSTISG